MKRHKITTKGWEFCIDWKDGIQSWYSLNDLTNNNNHVELVQYDNTNSVTYQPAFRWWANQTLRKKDILLAKIAARKMSKNKIKCGIEIPNNVS